MTDELDPTGPRYGITDLQRAMLTHYAPSTQKAPMDCPVAANKRTSVRALVRRRLLSRAGCGRLFISDRGRTALTLRRPDPAVSL